ncbi:hypothetical protein D3C74_186330 [compost metagenome]
MKKFNVVILGSPSIAKRFEIEGETLLDAIKINFENLIYKANYHHVPYRYPITAKPEYKKGIIGGRGGVSLNLSWMYTDNSNKPQQIKTNEIWIEAKESDLTSTEQFVILGN